MGGTGKRYRKPIFGKRTSRARRAYSGLPVANSDAFDAVKNGLTMEEVKEQREKEAEAMNIYQDILALSKKIVEQEVQQEIELSDLSRSILTEKEIRFDELAASAGKREDPKWPGRERER